MNVSIINPTTHPNWDSLLETSDQTTFFHTAAWAKVLSESYGYKPLYFTIIDGGRLSGLVPVMEIDSFLTGRRGVSLPFTDICNPIADSGDIFRELLSCITQYGKRAGWKCIELRGGSGFLDDAPANSEKCTHTISLNGDMTLLSKSFRDSTRRNIRKAVREGIDITFGHTRKSLKTFYSLHCKTRKRHGLPPQPWSFFEKVHEHIITLQYGFVVMAAYQGYPVAGAVYFHFRNQAIFKYGASDRNHLCHRPNNLVLWEAIKNYSQKGLKVLDLGRTELKNIGLRQFKKGWGSDERKASYYQYDIKKERFVAENKAPKKFYTVFKHLPIPLMRLTGNLLYKHVG
jgi:Acetyltransferase (GNAT) domain